MRSRARVLMGLALVWGALGVLGYRLGWQVHASRGRQALLSSARTVVHRGAQCSGEPLRPGVDGVLAGVLSIPSLGVQAPVESGTSDRVLNVAVGHFDGTPWPGSPGAAALLAHDVSYFARIDRLQRGDRIVYRSGCVAETFTVVGHRIVRDGAPLPPVQGTAMVLDTCWPTDALWFTPDRYTVEAVESAISVAGPAPARTGTRPSGTSGSSGGPGSSGGSGGSTGPSEPGQAGGSPPTTAPRYTTPAPAGLRGTGLTLTDNEEPMGTMAIAGAPSARWVQSPAPLALEAAALSDLFGGYHAAARGNAAWWSAVAPGVAMPPALAGATAVLADATPLDVTIDAAGDVAHAVTLQAVVPLRGGSAPGTYDMHVTEAVRGTTVVITNWEAHRD